MFVTARAVLCIWILLNNDTLGICLNEGVARDIPMGYLLLGYREKRQPLA
jgi:hypothetical protein